MSVTCSRGTRRSRPQGEPLASLAPRAREAAVGYRVLRNVDDPGEVVIQVELASVEDARVARERLLASGVPDRFADRSGPTVLDGAEDVSREGAA